VLLLVNLKIVKEYLHLLSACNSCYNKVRLDAGDWEWCPEHKETDRQFECTKTINPTMILIY
jgi:hypothetical protein